MTNEDTQQSSALAELPPTTKEAKPRRPKGTGCVYRRSDSPVWWLKYSEDGRVHSESSHETDKQKALDALKKKLAQIETGTFVSPRVQRIRVEELAEDFLRDYRINGQRSLDDVTTRRTRHLKPFFGIMRAVEVTTDRIARYIDARQSDGAANATINREIAALKRMFYLGYRATPPKVQRVPAFSKLKENNVRKGFLDDAQYRKLVEGAELWFRTLVECGRTYGWRISELLQMRVGQVDLAQRVIRLEPGTTKNSEGREVLMTDAVFTLLSASVLGKNQEDYVFRRKDGKPVRDIRNTWENACVRAGVGAVLCVGCSAPSTAGRRCKKCKAKHSKYTGLIFHDLRRTAARNLRRAGISETVIMKIGGWKTRSVFERYAIVNRSDMATAIQQLQQSERELQPTVPISYEISYAAKRNSGQALPAPKAQVVEASAN